MMVFSIMHLKLRGFMFRSTDLVVPIEKWHDISARKWMVGSSKCTQVPTSYQIASLLHMAQAILFFAVLVF